MKRKIYRTIIFLIFIIFLIILYLSVIGINTKKFNSQIISQIKNIEPDLELKINEVSARLNLFTFSIDAKTVCTDLVYRNKTIKIENIKSKISLKSLIKDQFALSTIFISTKSIPLKDLIEISGGLLNTTYMDRVQVDRIVPHLDRKKTGKNRTLIDIDLNNYFNSKDKFNIVDGDIFEFFSINKELSDYVEIKGEIIPPNKLLTSLINSKKCFYYKTTVKKKGNKNHWYTIIDKEMTIPFLINDGTGDIAVDPKDADISNLKYKYEKIIGEWVPKKDIKEIPEKNIKILHFKWNINKGISR